MNVANRATPLREPRGEELLLAGFDAGQTHTTCRLRPLSGESLGEPLAEGTGPGVVHLAAPEGPRRFQEALGESLAQARRQLEAQGAPQAAWPLAAAGIGASGIEHGSTVQEQGLLLAASSLGLRAEQLVVTGDERTALAGAFPQGPGILVISGTGTIAIGRDGAGRHHRCAGWGWLLDGAGSAMDIGRDGLSLSLRMADGRHPDGPLRQALWEALDLEPEDPATPQAIKAKVVAAGFGPAGFAALAPVVDRRATAADPQAQAILERQATALADMVTTIASRLDLAAPAVCSLGGALQHLGEFRRAYLRALRSALPQAQPQEAAGDGCDGALRLAAAMVVGANLRRR